ncbi:MAG: hypothetical protein HUJ66_01670 [Oscillospiraceae bacterium]|nr:hypothetical protein [Oscillospiraceae bacterium]
MIRINVNYTGICVSRRQLLAVGNINSIPLEFEFSEHWQGLSRLAVFRNGETSVTVSLGSAACCIPWEVLAEAGEVFLALRGVGDGGGLVLCTETVSLGRVLPGIAAEAADPAREATPGVIDTLLSELALLKASGGGGGSPGKSAYEIALDHGFSGTQEQWLASLKGADGADGADGRTPVRGADYFTAADKAELVNAVLAALPVWSGGAF